MAFKPLDLMDPEETVGNLWHNYAQALGAEAVHDAASVRLSDLRPSVAILFRALGGPAGVEVQEAPATASRHRLSLTRQIGTPAETTAVPAYDGERLRLPPLLACFPDPALNRAAYLWLTALAALSGRIPADLPDPGADPYGFDRAQLRLNAAATRVAWTVCPGLLQSYWKMSAVIAGNRPDLSLPPSEAAMERAIRAELKAEATLALPSVPSPRGYRTFAPVPIWLRFTRPGQDGAAGDATDDPESPPPGATVTNRKIGLRRDASEANRKDSFIIHRFEAILSWVESMNLNRSVHDDDDENAQKAAEDQDNVTLSQHDRKAATRLRLHLDLSPADADHERLADTYTYPEWNHRSRSYMPDHCRVLEVEADPGDADGFAPDTRRIQAVRRQFEVLHPRRVIRPRQIDGAELDLDAAIEAQVDLRATGRGSDRVWQDSRQIERDLSVAFLVDTSRSTEAAMGETCVIDVARDSLSALAGGIDAAGDRLAIWGFSSLRRDRVFLTRVKGFDTSMSEDITRRICALKPGHYTRLGAAIRHASAMLADETSVRRLLIVLTDGKPNDLDHYEGQHGIEDSHMAVREARSAGQTVYGVVIDEDGQDWFARIFGRGGFTLLPHPARLARALPDIYRSLTQET